MPTDRRRKTDPELTPFQDPAFRRHSVHFDDIEFQRRFEQNIIRYGFRTAAQITEEINNTVIVSGGGGGGGHDIECYWVKEGSNLVYYDGNVGVKVHPHSNDFEVRGNVLVEAKAEAPYVEIRNWSDTAYDPTLRWALGATPETMFCMGVDDSDSNKLKIANGVVLGSTAGWSFGTTIIFANSYATATNQILAVSTSALGVLTDYSLAPPYASGGIFNCIYVHTDSTVYVCDNDLGVAHFDANLNLLHLYTNSWFTATSSIYGICYWDGYFYVATSGTGTTYDGVFQFDSTFSVATRYLGSADSGDPDYIVTPKGIATDGTYFYVCNNPVGLMVFTMAGVFVETITTANSLALINVWGVQADGTYVYVTERTGARIVVLSASDRSWVADLDVSGTNYTPWDVTVDDDYVYACIFEDVVDFIRVIKFQKSDWSLISDTQVKRPGGLNSSSRGIGILREYVTVEDLIVLHQDGSYLEVYPVTRFMDDIRLHESALTTSDYVGLAAPAAVTASYTLALPVAAAGATKHLYSDAANQLAFGQDVTPTGSPSFVRVTLTQAVGTAPLTVTSTTLVTNLNADMLDGYHFADLSTYFGQVYIAAAANPTVNDDINQTPTAFREGCVWVNQAANYLWFCADNADGAAVWYGLNQSLLTTSNPTFDAPTVTGLIVTDGGVIEGDALTGIWNFYAYDKIRFIDIALTDEIFIDPKSANLGIGTEIFGGGKKTLAIGTGAVAPTSSPADSIQLYSADFAPGNACPYFRTENGTVIGLNQSLLTTDGPTFDHAHLTAAAYIGNINISNYNIYQNTADGSDDSYIYLSGGGGANVSRGGYIAVAGNEYSVDAAKGAVYIFAGAGDGGSNKGNIYLTNSADAIAGYNTVWINPSGYLGIGTEAFSPEAKLQVGKILYSGEVIGNTPVCRFLGGAQSQASETILRLVRPISAGVYYGGSVDFNVYAYQAGGAPYNPATQLDICLKSAESYTETANVTVMTLTAQGNVGFGQTTFGTSAAKVLAIASGTAPSTSPTDCFQNYSADAASVAGHATSHWRSEAGGIFSIEGGAGAVHEYRYSATLADDAVLTLPFSITNVARGFIAIGNNQERTGFWIDNDGDAVLINNSTNVVANADTDGNLCVGTAAAQEPLQIKNRLGSSLNLFIVMWYN
jgi:hypothetical protein